MHGEITLESALGSGTTATFSIPFNKPQFHGSGSPLIDLGSIPDRLQGEMSVSGHGSDYDRQSGTPPQSPLDHRSDRLSSMGPGASSLHPPSDHDMSLPEAERSKVHVLVVEDK